MIRTGSLQGKIEYDPARSARLTKAFRQELGSAGITPAMREADAAGNHVIKVEQAEASKEDS